MACNYGRAGVLLTPETERNPTKCGNQNLNSRFEFDIMSGSAYADSFYFLSAGNVIWNGVYVNPYQAIDNTSTRRKPFDGVLRRLEYRILR